MTYTQADVAKNIRNIWPIEILPNWKIMADFVNLGERESKLLKAELQWCHTEMDKKDGL